MVLACSGMVADELINDMHVPKTKVLYNTINMSRYNILLWRKSRLGRNLAWKDDDFVVSGKWSSPAAKTFWIF